MIISVNSFEEAKSYPVLYNSSELLMDNNRDVFYVKSVDSMGKYTINTYRFEQIENEKPLTSENFVTKEQFADLSGKLDYLIQQLGGSINGQQHSRQQTVSQIPPVADVAPIPAVPQQFPRQPSATSTADAPVWPNK